GEVQGRPDGLHVDRILFCAKEATYKAWFPLTHRWLGFEDAHITFGVGDSGTAGLFESRILIDPAAESGPPLQTLSGRWSVRDGLALTAIVLGPTLALSSWRSRRGERATEGVAA